MGAYIKTQTATIAVGEHTSNAIYLGDKLLAEIRVPADTEGTHLAFQRSVDGVTYVDAYDDANGLVLIPFTAGRSLSFSESVNLGGGAHFIKLRTADAQGANVVQADADAALTVITRRWTRW